MKTQRFTPHFGAFTFTELIIVVTILAILSTIGFVSYVSFIGSSRDTKRSSDLSLIQTSLNGYKQQKGAYPSPGNSFNIINNTTEIVALQGKLNKNVNLSNLDILPLDPKNNQEYFYSVTPNKQEFEVAGTLENGDIPKSILMGTYKSVSKNTLPTIMLAISSTTDIEIADGVGDGTTNRNLFIFNDSEHNYPYGFETELPYTDGTLFADLLLDAESKDYWQNSDYTSCLEIYEAGKSISSSFATQEYQYLTGGTLTSSNCDMSGY